jgi:CheY-like chemotaxis protein
LHREHGSTIALAILDLTMPDLDGVQTQEHLAAQGFAAPTLFVSGYAAPDDIADLTAGPNVRFLQKPFTIPELEAAIAAILPNREKKG